MFNPKTTKVCHIKTIHLQIYPLSKAITYAPFLSLILSKLFCEQTPLNWDSF